MGMTADRVRGGEAGQSEWDSLREQEGSRADWVIVLCLRIRVCNCWAHGEKIVGSVPILCLHGFLLQSKRHAH